MAKSEKNDDSLLKEFEKLVRAIKRAGDTAADKADRQLGVTGKIRNQISQIHTLQEGMLARGSDLAGLMKSSEQVTRQLTDGIDGLDSGLAGYHDALGAAADAYKVGMDTNNYAVNRLLLRSKFTDKQNQQLAHAMRAATAGTGMSSAQMGELAITVQSLSERFNISATDLMGAMGALGQTLKMMKGLGIAKEGQEVAALFGAALGTGAEKFGAEFISKLAAGDAIKTRSMLGIQDKMQKFYKGGEGAAGALTEAAVKAAFEIKKQKDMWTEGANAMGQAYSKGNEQFGGAWDEGMQLYNGFVEKYGEKTEEQIVALLKKEAADKEIQNKFTDTWAKVKSDIFGPLMEGLLRFQKAFYALLKKPWFKNIIKVLSSLVIAIGVWKMVIAPIISAFKIMNNGRKSLGRGLTKLKDAINKHTMKMTRVPKGQGKLSGRFAGKKGILTRAGDWMGTLTKKITGSAFFIRLQNIFISVKGAILKFPKLIGGYLLKGLTRIGPMLLTAIQAIPVWGQIVLAIVALGALIYYFWEPIKKTFIQLWNWVKSIPSQISAGFKKGFWSGVWAIIKILTALPMLIVTGIWSVIKWLAQKLVDGFMWVINKLPFVGGFMTEDDAAAAIDINGASLAEQKKTNEMQEIQAKEAQENMDQKKRDEITAQQRQTTNELLRALNEGMSAEHIRSEAAEALREQALEAAKVTAENSGKTRPSSTVTTYTTAGYKG